MLRAIAPFTPENIVRGQFRGYRDEEGVDPKSDVETFVAARFTIDNWRWAGVPFCIRAGKSMAVTATEVLIEFKETAPVLPGGAVPHRNHLRFRFEPDTMIALGVSAKTPGEGLVGEPTELVAAHGSKLDMLPYERLLGDALRGDATAFAKESDVDHGWRIVDPVIKAATPMFSYEPGHQRPGRSRNRIVGPRAAGMIRRQSGGDGGALRVSAGSRAAPSVTSSTSRRSVSSGAMLETRPECCRRSSLFRAG